MPKRSFQSLRSKKTLLITPLILLVVIGALEAVGAVNLLGAQKSSNDQSSSDDLININKDKPKKNNDETNKTDKQTDPKDDEPSTPPPSNNKKGVTPVISSAQQDGSTITVKAYIPGIFEEGGVCLAKFTKSGQTVSETSAGFENVSYTTCAPIKIPRSEFAISGNWSLVVSYKSAKSEGASASETIKIN